MRHYSLSFYKLILWSQDSSYYTYYCPWTVLHPPPHPLNFNYYFDLLLLKTL
jgi:hypothetical protein